MDLLKASDKELASLRPSVFTPDLENQKLDQIVRDAFLDDFTRLRQLHPENYYLDRIGSAIFYRIPWLLCQPRELSEMNALELGCGKGIKAIPWARLFKS